MRPQGIVKDLTERGIATDSDGATVIFNEVGAVPPRKIACVDAVPSNTSIRYSLWKA